MLLSACATPNTTEPASSPESTQVSELEEESESIQEPEIVELSIATIPAEIVELVEIGMTRSAINELIDKSYFELIAIQLSEFSNIGGKIKMVPRETDDTNPATYIVHLYLSGEYHPAYVVYSMSKE